MSSDLPRDPSLDRLLRDELSQETAPGASPCLDAETLAAWSDGALGVQEAAHVESHLATCAACQAMMAAFARSAPAVNPVPAARPRRSMWWAWPMAAAAAASVLFLLYMWRRPPVVVPVQTEARRTEPAPAAEAPQVTPVPPPAASTTPAPHAVAARPKAAPTRVSPPVPLPVAAGAAPPPPGMATLTQLPPPPPQAPPVAAPQGQLVEPRAVALRSAAAAGAATAAEPAAMQPVSIIAEFSSPAMAPGNAAGGGGGRGGGRGGGGRGGSPASTAQVRWRILASGIVERSLDLGATWTTVAIDSSVPPLTGGAAPTGRVCWLIGRAGTVLLSTDAATFRRLTFPSPADLTSIVATSPRQAVVTTADGRTFTTSDGGQTWTEKT